MDSRNRIHSEGTYRVIRAENIGLLMVCTCLLVQHREHVNWVHGFIAFWLIDVVGYLPGAWAHRRSRGKPIAQGYYVLYNVAHNYLVGGMGIVLWAWVQHGFEWAMLAVPIHYSIDRGIFGNILKPGRLSFEPSQASDEVIHVILGRKQVL